MDVNRQTVLHIAAEKCSAHLCRLLITRGCDGAIADVWGKYCLHNSRCIYHMFFNSVCIVNQLFAKK